MASKTEQNHFIDERYRLLFDSNPHPTWLYDVHTLQIIDVNPAALRNYGYTRDEFLSLTIKDLRQPEDVPSMLQSAAKADENTELKSTWRHRTKHGSIIDVEVASRPLNYEGRAARLVVATDITKRKKAEEKLSLQNAQLEAANKELEAFSYSVSHDLRSPLRSIDGFSQALLEDCAESLDQTGKDYLARIRAATQRMGALIDDLLNLSRVARAEIHHEQINLSSIAAGIVVDLRKTAPDRKVEFEIEDGLEERGDSRLIRIVFENLLGNAWKFTSKHASAHIQFGRTKVNGSDAYFVRDDGAGFDSRYADKLFGAFQRLHAMSEFPGTGVGLATVQRIIHRHGGKVWAEGSPEKGATFYFTL